MLTLDVVNDMLGTMGEAPLSSLQEAHAFRGTCLNVLASTSRRIQARGWWFNMDEVVLQPMLNQRIALPNDVMSVRTNNYAYVKRGEYLYDVSTSDYLFTADVPSLLIRNVPFDQLPETAAAYIGAEAVERFQKRYDGDPIKNRDLVNETRMARAECNIEHTRNRKANLILSNDNLMRIKSASNRLFRYTINDPRLPGGR